MILILKKEEAIEKIMNRSKMIFLSSKELKENILEKSDFLNY